MKILIADDSEVTLELLEMALTHWGHEVVRAKEGKEALRLLLSEEAPRIAILDWMMPELDGLSICRKVREANREGIYIILLTARDSQQDLIRGLEAGADDYITKPFNKNELRARIGVGIRIVRLQESLAQRIQELENALSQVKKLSGLLPICSYCKKIRDDKNYWQQVEAYLTEHTEASFSHSICPECYEKHVKENLDV